MPSLEEEPTIEVTSPDSSVVLATLSTTSSDYNTSQDSDFETINFVISTPIEIPREQSLKEILISTTGMSDLMAVSQLKLQVIAHDVSLQHLSIHTPNLSELTLDGSVMSSLRDLGCELKKLKILKVSRCGLTSLDGMFGLESLEEFHAANNVIEDLSPCAFLDHIKLINLKFNSIRNINLISFLSVCSKLEHLLIEGNVKVTRMNNYRDIIKTFLPHLKTLDDLDFDQEPRAPSPSIEVAVEDKVHFLPAINAKSGSCNTPRPSSSKLSTNSQFSVSFPPKVLSPRVGSADSVISTSVKSILPDINKKNSHSSTSPEDSL